MIVACLLWEFLCDWGVLPKASIPSFTDVMSALRVDVASSELWTNVGITLRAWAEGMIICLLVGVPAGIVLGLSRWVYQLTQVSLEFVRTVPSTAAIPLLIILYGSGLHLAVVMVVLGSIWPLVINTMYGVHDVDPVAVEAGRAYGLGRIGIFRRIVLRSTLPYIATGLRLAATIALILAISASLIGGGNGLGALIADASNSSATKVLYARVFVAGLLGLGVTVCFSLLERRLLFWHPSQRGQQL